LMCCCGGASMFHVCHLISTLTTLASVHKHSH
jgi:hypothetical protein